ncbi:MAG: protein translocase subunit SecF [Armatimonadota bacterium]|jgi:preprotein translocase subunit SecF|nr:protein translocase subunit SecF [Armatimonadota bacterium]MDT7971698.1 protein translocase subunit SecF [Armatimonadota bacterium]
MQGTPITPTERIDLVGKTRLWLGIALAVMVVGFLGLAMRGLNLGIDFTGGALYQFRFPQKVATTTREEVRLAGEVRTVLRRLRLPSAPVIQVAEGDTLLIRLKLQNERESERWRKVIAQALKKRYPNIEEATTEFIGSTVGGELTTAAIWGTVLGLLGISAWIWLRYQILGAGWLFALGALFALAHDVLVLIGFVAWSHIEVNSAFIAALLTVAGYSVQDTVIIYDRIRENLRVRRGWALERIVNFSLLETMPRSINTSLTTALSLIAILLVGGVAVKPLALSLLFGIVSGTYSSIFIAAPLVLVLQKWWEKRQAGRPQPVKAVRPTIAGERRPILQLPTERAAPSAQESEGSEEAKAPTGTILRPTPTAPPRRRRKRRR